MYIKQVRPVRPSHPSRAREDRSLRRRCRFSPQGGRGAGLGLGGRGAAPACKRGGRGELGRRFAAQASPLGARLREAGSRGEGWRGRRGGALWREPGLPGRVRSGPVLRDRLAPRGPFAWDVWREGLPGSGDAPEAQAGVSPDLTGEVKGLLVPAECVAPPHSVVTSVRMAFPRWSPPHR